MEASKYDVGSLRLETWVSGLPYANLKHYASDDEVDGEENSKSSLSTLVQEEEDLNSETAYEPDGEGAENEDTDYEDEDAEDEDEDAEEEDADADDKDEEHADAENEGIAHDDAAHYHWWEEEGELLNEDEVLAMFSGHVNADFGCIVYKSYS